MCRPACVRHLLLNRLTRFLRQKTRAGGCCDCGDHEAWKKEGFCRYTPPSPFPLPPPPPLPPSAAALRRPDHNLSKHSGVALNSLADIPQTNLNRWGPAFRALVDFIVDAYVGRAGGAPGLDVDGVDLRQNM